VTSESLAAKVDSVASAFVAHDARETKYQLRMEERYGELQKKLDAHLAEHTEMMRTFKKSVVGAAFTIVGTVVLWVLGMVKDHFFFRR
jgi:predicted GTPase